MSEAVWPAGCQDNPPAVRRVLQPNARIPGPREASGKSSGEHHSSPLSGILATRPNAQILGHTSGSRQKLPLLEAVYALREVSLGDLAPPAGQLLHNMKGGNRGIRVGSELLHNMHVGEGSEQGLACRARAANL